MKQPLTDDDIGDNIYDYLVIDVSMKDKRITLLKTGLINKILNTTGYESLIRTVKTPEKDTSGRGC